jgi:hypothetical protein
MTKMLVIFIFIANFFVNSNAEYTCFNGGTPIPGEVRSILIVNKIN